MLSQYYIKSQNRINYAKKYPNNGVKCSVCQLIFPIHQIEHHMSTHIAPQYMAPNTKQNTIKKMARPKLFVQQKQNDFMSTALNTVRPQQLPKCESVRNIRSIPQQLVKVSNSQQLAKPSQFTQVKAFDATETQTVFNLNNLQIDHFQRQNIQQSLNLLEPENISFQKTFMQTYSSELRPKISFQTTQTGFVRPARIQQKKQVAIKQDDAQTQAYEIKVEQKKMFEGMMPVFKKEPEVKVEVNVQKYKPPEVRSQSISTKSKMNKQIKKSSSFSFLGNIFGCQESSTATKQSQIVIDMANTTGSFWKTSNSNLNKIEHKCSDCGGFYCTTCHSTIPPQYRPCNTNKKDQKISQFYKNVVYANKGCNEVKQFQISQKQCQDCSR